MKRVICFIGFLALAPTPALSSALTFSIGQVGVLDPVTSRFGEKDHRIGGVHLDWEVVESLRVGLLLEYTWTENRDYHPARGRRVASATSMAIPYFPHYSGEIFSERESFNLGIPVRYQVYNLEMGDDGDLLLPYLVASPVLRKEHLRLSDGYAAENDRGWFWGWRAGAGVEIVFVTPEVGKGWSLFLQVERQEVQVKFDVGGGFGPRQEGSRLVMGGIRIYSGE